MPFNFIDIAQSIVPFDSIDIVHAIGGETQNHKALSMYAGSRLRFVNLTSQTSSPQTSESQQRNGQSLSNRSHLALFSLPIARSKGGLAASIGLKTSRFLTLHTSFCESDIDQVPVKSRQMAKAKTRAPEPQAYKPENGEPLPNPRRPSPTAVTSIHLLPSSLLRLANHPKTTTTTLCPYLYDIGELSPLAPDQAAYDSDSDKGGLLL